MNLSQIGDYRLIKRVAKGGMGLVYRAWDTRIGREVALKKMRDDLKAYRLIKDRFLKEARLTAKLCHPSIVPILGIYDEGDELYYIMPFIEGVTLKQYIRRLKMEGEEMYPASLARYFMAVAQAMAHAHSRGVIHRDLKAENIMIGKQGEVLILDWGLARRMDESDEPSYREQEIKEPKNARKTSPGKVAGTLAYLAPERLKGPATPLTDIYSLGVLLYLMTAFKLPFKRPDLKTFKAQVDSEVFVDPREVAPTHDIPEQLVRMMKLCLAPDPKERYQSVEELICDLKTFMDGRSEWQFLTELDPQEESDWQLQEHVLLDPAQLQLSQEEPAQQPALPLWATLMISEQSINGNLKLESELEIDEKSEGLGFLINVAEEGQRQSPFSGYFLWLGTPKRPGGYLSRDGAVVMHLPQLTLRPGFKHRLSIEKIDNALYCCLDKLPKITYISYLPLAGTHVGLLLGPGSRQNSPIKLYAGGLALQVSCLAIPDAFLATGHLERAWSEYKRIAHGFPGYSEGREALFRSGITLIELGKREGKNSKYFKRALETFERLRETASPPLEWLGKSLVYQAQGNAREEINCLELGLRRYPKHSQFRLLEEQVAFRLQACSLKDRSGACRLSLLMARVLPRLLHRSDIERQLSLIDTQLDKVPFHFELPDEDVDDPIVEINEELMLITEMAFWLKQPLSILDAVEHKAQQLLPCTWMAAYLAVFYLGEEELLKELEDLLKQPRLKKLKGVLERPLEEASKQTTFALAWVKAKAEKAMGEGLLDEAKTQLDQAAEAFPEHKASLVALMVEFALRKGQWKEAKKLLEANKKSIHNEKSPLFYLYACLLAKQEGKKAALAHLEPALVLRPRMNSLLAHDLLNKQFSTWLDQAFFWEKQALEKQKNLFKACLEAHKEACSK